MFTLAGSANACLSGTEVGSEFIIEPQSVVVEAPLTEYQSVNRINRVTLVPSIVRVIWFTIKQWLAFVFKARLLINEDDRFTERCVVSWSADLTMPTTILTAWCLVRHSLHSIDSNEHSVTWPVVSINTCQRLWPYTRSAMSTVGARAAIWFGTTRGSNYYYWDAFSHWGCKPGVYNAQLTATWRTIGLAYGMERVVGWLVTYCEVADDIWVSPLQLGWGCQPLARQPFHRSHLSRLGL